MTRSDGSLTASWPAVKHATGYHITYSSDGGGSWSLAALNHPSAGITISGVDNAKTYIVGVRARNDSGDSGWTNSPAAGPYTPPKPTPTPTPEPTPPPPPSSVSVTRSGGTLEVSWPAVTGATSYNVNTTDDDMQSWQRAASDVTGTSATLTGIDDTKTYYVAVQSSNADGAGGWTNSSAVAPLPAKTLSFGSSVADQSYNKDTAIATLNLPAATASTGSPTITYTLTPTLPAGLSFDASARTVSGTPTAAAASATYTYTAAAADYTAATLTFSIVVADAVAGLSFGSSTIANQSYVKDTAIDALTLPQATGGSGTITYSLSPSLPNGLSFDATARTISGTPTATGATYRYSATDGADTVTLSFTLEVAQAEEGAGIAASCTLTFNGTISDLVLTRNTAMTSITLPASNASGTLTYSTSILPAGVSFNATTRALSGTPTALQTAKSYDYWVTDENSDCGRLSFNITVNTALKFRNALGNQVYGATAAVNAKLPLAHGLSGNPPIDYTLTGTLPAGLSYHDGKTAPYNPAITGTPTTKTAAANFTYTATSRSDSADTVSVTFTVEVRNLPHKAGTLTMTRHDTVQSTMKAAWSAVTSDGGTTSYEIGYRTRTVNADNTKPDTLGSWTVKTGIAAASTGDEITGLSSGANAHDKQYESKQGYNYDWRIRAVSAAGAGPWSDHVEGRTSGNINSYFTKDSDERSIAENSAAGTDIGAAVTATDPDSAINTTKCTVRHQLTGTDAAHFQLQVTGLTGRCLGQLAVKSALDYESKKEYSVTVQTWDNLDRDGINDGVIPNHTIDDSITITIKVTDVNEPPPAPATPTVAANAATPKSKLDVSWTAPTMTGKPAISDYDVQYRLSGATTWTSHAFTGTGTSTTLPGLTTGKSYEVQVRAVNAEGNGAWSASGAVTTGANAVTRSIVENSAAGTNVGAVVTANANSKYTYSYSLGGTDKDDFGIGSATGQITVGTGTSLDYETKPSYSVTVVVAVAAKAQGGASAQSLDPNAPGNYTIPVTINLTDVNEAPTFDDGATATRNIAERADATVNVGTAVAATDQDGDTLYYSMSGSGTNHFRLNSTASGQISVRHTNTIDYETKSTYSVTLSVSDRKDANGNADTVIDDTIAVTINVTDSNADPEPVANFKAANKIADPRTSILLSWTEFTTTDPDYRPVNLYYIWWKQTSENTWEQPKTGGLAIINAYANNVAVTSYEVSGLARRTSYDIRILAEDDLTVTSLAPHSEVTLATRDFLDPAFSSDTATRSIAENSAAGTNVGAAVAASDPYPNNVTPEYTLSGTDAGKFNIGSTTGQLTVKTGNVPNYEAKTSYSVTVSVSDKRASDGTTDTVIDDTIAITVNVTDVDEPPPQLAAPTVAANSATPTTKLDVSWTAPTTAQMSGKPAVNDYDVQYRLSGATGWTSHGFTGTGTSTTLTGLTSGKTYEVQVRAVNVEGNGAWSNAASAVTQAGGVTRSIVENSAAGTNVGAVVTAKANSGYTYTHSLDGTDKASFDIVAASGQIKVKAGNIPDYETKSSYSVTVVVAVAAKAQGGATAQSLDPNAPGSYKIPVSISVTDVNEAPTLPDIPKGQTNLLRSVAENSATGSNVGPAVAAADQEGDTLYYSLSGDNASDFDIGETTGQITVKSALNYEAKTTYLITVNVKDKKDDKGNADTAVDDTVGVYVRVTDVNEPPPAPDAPTVAKHSLTPAAKLEATWTAPDTTGIPAVTDYDVQYRQQGDSTWASYPFNGPGVGATLFGLTAGKSYEVQVRASNPEGTGAWSDSGSAITDGGGMTRSVDENSAAGTNVGAPVTAKSTNTTYTYTHAMSGTDAGKFEIGSATGQITVKSGTGLDYETKTSYSVTVTVTAAAKTQGANAQSLDPNAPGDYVVPVTVNVTDVNEPPTISTPTVVPNSTTPTTKLDVSWTAPTMTGKPAVTDYDVQYRKAHSSDWTDHTHNGTATTATISGLTENEHYEVRVKAINDEGNSGWSNSGHATTNANSVTINIDENSAAGAVVDTVTKTIDSSYTKAHTLSGTDAGKFNIAGSAGVITLADGTGLDYEAKDHYDVTVELDATKQGSATLNYDIVVIIQVDDVDEPPAAPALTVATNTTTPTTKIDVSWTAPDMTGKPALSGYDLQYRQHGASDWTDATFTGTSTTLTGLTSGKSYEVQVRAKNDEGESPWASGSAITDAAAPGAVTRNVAENSGAGANVGSPVTATANPNGYTLTHSLSGTDASDFTIESSSGQIKVKSALNYESGNISYRVTVTVKAAKSGGGASAQSLTLEPNNPGDYVVPVTINVTDVAEPPAKLDAPTVTSSGTSANKTLKVSWTAPDMTGKPAITDYDVRYKKRTDSGWTSHSFTGTGTSTTITGQVGGVNYDVQVRATNDEGSSPWSDSGDLDNADPKLPANPTRSIAENSNKDTNIGAPITATDPEGDTLEYTLGGTDADKFDFDTATAQITVKEGNVPDYEAKTSYSVTVSVSDKLDSELNADTAIDDTVTVTINVTDVNEPPGAPGTPTAKESTTTSITATWTEADVTGRPPIIRYWVKYWEKGREDVAYSVWTVSTNEALIDEIPDTHNPSAPLKPCTNYRIEVMAENDEGYGPWSATATLQTGAVYATRRPRPRPRRFRPRRRLLLLPAQHQRRHLPLPR